MNREQLFNTVFDTLYRSLVIQGEIFPAADEVADALWPVLAQVWEEAYLQGWRQRDGQGSTPNPYGEVPAPESSDTQNMSTT